MLLSSKNMPNDYVCNGCGSGWSAKVVPDTIYGISIFESCKRHDWAYHIGGTYTDFKLANLEFLQNMLTQISEGSKWYTPTFLANRRAMSYFEAVERFGESSFNFTDLEAINV